MAAEFVEGKLTSNKPPIERVAIIDNDKTMGLFYGIGYSKNGIYNSPLPKKERYLNPMIALLILLTDHPTNQPLIIIMPSLYAYNVVTRYLKVWKEHNWLQSNGTLVPHGEDVMDPLYQNLKLHSKWVFRYFPSYTHPQIVKDGIKYVNTMKKYLETS